MVSLVYNEDGIEYSNFNIASSLSIIKVSDVDD